MSDRSSPPSSSQKRDSIGACSAYAWYQYDPLDLPKHQIRLLKVEKTIPTVSPNSERIVCTLGTFDLDTVPSYLTLSYTWGTSNMQHVIHINEQRYSINPNLFEFLRTFAGDTVGKHIMPYLWIDQLCIDQSNALEKNHQVGLMAEIYRRCNFVITWLDRSAEAAVGDFKQCHSSKAAWEIMQNRYFTRLWVVQELVLGPTGLLYCAGIWIEWDMLKQAFTSIWSQTQPGEYGIVDLPRPLQQIFMKDYQTVSLSYEIQDSIEIYGRQECYDPRDKVYGLLSFTRNKEDIVVDYRKTLQEVYLDAAYAALITFKVRTRGHQIILERSSNAWTRFYKSRINDFIRMARTLLLPEIHISALNVFFTQVFDSTKEWLLNASPAASSLELRLGFQGANSVIVFDRWWFERGGARYYAECTAA
jgi:hypothetical protein